MNNKLLKKMSREELLQLLLMQTEQNELLEAKLAEAEAELAKREIAIADSESMAHAALRLSGIFEAADAAAQQYLENVRLAADGGSLLVEKIEAEAQARSEKLIKRTEELCRKKLEEADKSCAAWRKKTSEECNALIEKTEAQCRAKYEAAEKYWQLAADFAKRNNFKID